MPYQPLCVAPRASTFILLCLLTATLDEYRDLGVLDGASARPAIVAAFSPTAQLGPDADCSSSALTLPHICQLISLARETLLMICCCAATSVSMSSCAGAKRPC